MKLGHFRMAAVTQRTHLLIYEQVSVWTTVSLMTRAASFHARRRMLEHERPFYIGMALTAYRLLEPAELHPETRVMWIMAGSAGKRPFSQPMPFVERELCKRFLMTFEA